MELKQLKIKRGWFKSQLTLFEKFLNNLKDKPDDNALNILSLRLEKIVPLLEEFQAAQSEIEVLSEEIDEELNLTERESFQDRYFDLVNRANTILKQFNKTEPADNLSHSGSVGTERDTRSIHNSLGLNIKLPTINLPTFNGNFSHWREFSNAFQSLIHANNNIPDNVKLSYLKSSVTGEPADMLRSLQITRENYSVAWQKLNKRYNNERKIIYNHVRELLEVQTVSKDSAQNLQRFLNIIETNVECLRTWDQPVESWDALLVPIFMSKLDTHTNKEWESRVNKGGNTIEIPTLDDFLEFLNDKVNTLDAITVKSSSNKGQVTKTFSSFINNCIICNGDHLVKECDSFLKLNIDNRNSKIRELKLCLNCLRKGHFLSNCTSKSRCKKCSGKHHTLLHHEKTPTAQTTVVSTEETKNNTPTTINCSVYETGSKYAMLSTAIVGFYDNQNKQHDIRLLLDGASQSHLITEATCKRLNLNMQPIDIINLTGLPEGSLSIKYKTELTIHSKFSKFKETITCLVVPRIADRYPQQELSVTDFQIPPTIRLADPNYAEPGPIDLIIGVESFWDLLLTGCLKSENHPTLRKTKLGWIVTGSILMSEHVRGSNQTFCIMDTLHNDLERFWRIDEFIQREQYYTRDEQFCLDLFDKTTTRDPSGRFVVRLPLLSNVDELGDSLHTAKSRFYALERKFEGKEFKAAYTNCINDYLKQGHATESLPNQPNSFVLPHHAVIKESSQTTKLRVVFDGSCHLEEGKSINQIQHVGPTLQEDLFSIIARFRTHAYVLTGDITQMYRQIVVHEEDRKFQTFLWRNDPSEPLKIFELTRVTFGMTSAPFLAVNCLMQLAKENQETYPIESRIIKEDFYMDDMITGSDSVTQLEEIKINVRNILRSAGFELTKFNSNVPQLRDPNANVDDPLSSLDNNKALGVRWNPSSDNISYGIPVLLDQDRVTKRTILAQTATLFDPLGLLAPIIITAKILMQQLWQLKLQWDESVPTNICTRWIEFKRDLCWINDIKIPRQVLITKPNRIELHTFADASEKAYGACIYVKSINEDEDIQVHLLAAKSKVAPLKVVNLPRLELCAAVVAAQLATKFKTILRVKIDQEYFWTDSKITLGWIRSPPNKYKTFVANRIAEIQGLTDSNDWSHVRSAENPADLISRGTEAYKLTYLTLWWSGPNWLREEKTSSLSSYPVSSTDLPEEKTTANTFTITITSSFFPFKDFSLYAKTIRIMVYCLRFISNCRVRKEQRKIGRITATEMTEARLQLVRIAQNEVFYSEIQELKNGKLLHSKSKLLNLTPFIDNSGLLRVGGRLKLSNYTYDKKHPLLLPKDHHLTNLIFQYEHVNNLHCGPNLLLATIRERFWPIAGKNTAKRIVRQCVKCTKLRGETNQQIMGQLPRQRCLVMPPFHSTGMDYAGPFILKDRNGRGYKTYKAYICLFVCFSTKAMHLELVSDLSTKAFIATLKRFVSRRGKPLHLFSDNGTNFVGAKHELAELKDFILTKGTDIEQSLASDGIMWHMIPPQAPNQGGLWEAAVKSTKYHLRRVLGKTPLTYEDFVTILNQVESILNSRPLTPLSTDPNDTHVLTPAHFLIGRSFANLPDPDVTDVKLSHLDRFQHLQRHVQTFWNQWHKEYLNQLQVYNKWSQQGTSLKINDIVVIKEDNAPPAYWKLGRVQELHPGQDGVVRVVSVKCQKGVIKRPVNKLCLLPVIEQ